MRRRSKFLLLALLCGVTSWPAAAATQKTLERHETEVQETQATQDQAGRARFDLRVEAKQLSLREIGRFVPVVERIGLPPGFRIERLDVEGPLDRMRVVFAAGMDGSGMSGEVVLDLDGPIRAARGTSSLIQIDLANWLDVPALPSQLTADASFDLAFKPAGDRTAISGTYDVTAPSLAVAGYRLGDVSASGRIGDREIIVDGNAVAYGAGVTAKGRITLPHDGGSVRYALEGTARNLELRKLPETLPLPDIESNLRFCYDVSGSGADLRNRLVLSSSTVAGTRIPSATVTANRTRTGWSFEVDGRFAALDAARLTGRSGIDARMSGTMALQGEVSTHAGSGPTARVDLEDVTIGGTVALDRAVVEGLHLDGGKFVGRLANRALHLDEVRMRGPDLAVRLNGVFGLSPSVASNLSYYVETPPLASLPANLRFDLPLKGEMTLEGRIQGTSVLDITGTASGTNVGYGTTTALHARSTYHVALPRNDPAAANVEARTVITRLHAAGRSFEELVARTFYRDRRLAFDVRLTEARQTIDTAGYVIWHPSHQEIHLDRFELAAVGTTWRLASEQGATIEYGRSAIAIEDVRLVAPGNQSLSIEGTFGRDGAPLYVRASNLDLAAFEAWAGEYGFTGRLDVDPRLAGVLTSPRLDAEFRVAGGSFRDFAYQSLSGRVQGGGQAPLTFETRLVHDSTAWFEASGKLPADVFARLTAPLEAPVLPGGELAVRVRSSAIPLGFVQGLTNAVTDVDGVLQVNATIDGTMAAPRVGGALTINGGAFTVPRLGTHYTGLQTRVDFDARSLHVREFRMQDDDGRVLTLAGRLPLRAGGGEGLDLELRANGFEIIDNPDADIELDGALKIAGVLTQPRLTGDIAISSGTIVLDRLLRLRDDTYALRAADQDAIKGEVIRPEDDKGLLEGWPLALDLRLRIPALRLEGHDLQGPSNMPIGLGDVNVTAAGDLRLRKAPDGALRVTGDVRTTRGTYEFQGREFSLDRGGTIRFVGAEDINPMLDVTASRTVSAVEARVHIGGTLEEPTLSLSSSPPLEQADILSLIVFNRPVNELGAGEQVALTRRAAAMAAGIVASEITNALDDVLGVDLLDIEAATVNGVLAPAVTIGQQFGDLFVEVRQQFGPASPSQVVIEYRITDWFRIESAIVDRERESGPLLRRSEGTGIDAAFSFRR